MTANLLKKDFSHIPVQDSVQPPSNPASPDSANAANSIVVPWSAYGISRTAWDEQIRDSDGLKYIVYLNRNSTHGSNRVIDNERELLVAILAHLRPSYELVVIRHTDNFNTIPLLHKSWQRYARVLNKAVVMISPHGGAMNNLMWTSNDCHIVTFDEYPDRDLNPPVRGIFFHGWWSKVPPGAKGKFWIVEASKKNSNSFYQGKARIPPRDVLKVLTMIGVVNKDTIDWNNYPEENVTYWSK
jgi:hypothetical protein